MIYLLVASWGLIPRFFFTVQPDWAVNAINNPQFLGGNALGLFVRKNASQKKAQTFDELLRNNFTSIVGIIIVAIAIKIMWSDPALSGLFVLNNIGKNQD